jgi:hypothetical protein
MAWRRLLFYSRHNWLLFRRFLFYLVFPHFITHTNELMKLLFILSTCTLTEKKLFF